MLSCRIGILANSERGGVEVRKWLSMDIVESVGLLLVHAFFHRLGLKSFLNYQMR